jgi:hypothetical protein
LLNRGFSGDFDAVQFQHSPGLVIHILITEYLAFPIQSQSSVYSSHIPATVRPGDTLTVEVLKLEKLLVVLGSLELTFELDITVDSAESYPINNLTTIIVLRIFKIGSTPPFDLDHVDLLSTVAD